MSNAMTLPFLKRKKCYIWILVVFVLILYFHFHRKKGAAYFSYEAMLASHIGPIPSGEDVMLQMALDKDSGLRDAKTQHSDLYKRVRVLCFVLTTPSTLFKKAEHVRRTWGHKCNKLLFFSSKTNKTFPTIGLDVPEGYKYLSDKTMHAFRYIYKHHLNDAEWFFKADEDTFVILENLRHFLSDKNPLSSIYFGHHFKVILKQGFTSGGAGYVISKEALIRFGKHGHDTKKCNSNFGAEDVDFSSCMASLGVGIGNSTDEFGRSRFHCFHPETHLIGQYPGWYYSHDSNGAKMGEGAMSDYAISFHYVTPQHMYLLHYLIYHVHPYGITYQKERP